MNVTHSMSITYNWCSHGTTVCCYYYSVVNQFNRHQTEILFKKILSHYIVYTVQMKVKAKLGPKTQFCKANTIFQLKSKKKSLS